jgi:transposase
MTLPTDDDPRLEMWQRRARRRWTSEEKRRIVAECERPGSSVSLVARRHDLNTNLVFTWRRQLQRQQSRVGAEPGFVPAVIAASDIGAPRSVVGGRREHQEGPGGRPDSQGSGVIEIVLAGGRRVIIEERVSAAALARVIEVLEGR